MQPLPSFLKNRRSSVMGSEKWEVSPSYRPPLSIQRIALSFALQVALGATAQRL